MTLFLIFTTVISVTILVLVANRIQRLTRGMKLTEELAFLEAYLQQKPVNVRNYLFIRGKFDELKAYRIKNKQLDKLWNIFFNKYYEYFVEATIRKVV
jgi:hypothetical protein